MNIILSTDASCSKHRSCMRKAEKLHIQKANIVRITKVEKRVKIIKPPQNEIKKLIKSTSDVKFKNPRVQNLMNAATSTENSTTPVDQASYLPPTLNKV